MTETEGHRLGTHKEVTTIDALHQAEKHARLLPGAKIAIERVVIARTHHREVYLLQPTATTSLLAQICHQDLTCLPVARHHQRLVQVAGVEGIHISPLTPPLIQTIACHGRIGRRVMIGHLEMITTAAAGVVETA